MRQLQAVENKPANRIHKSRVKRMGAVQNVTPTHPVLQLQATIGNQATAQLIRFGIQAKLKVGEPNDRFEREAHRIADTVLRMGSPLHPPIIQRLPSTANDGAQREEEEDIQTLQRQEEEEEVQLLQRRSPSTVPPVPPGFASRLRSTEGHGHPLPPESRGFFESRFHQDFNSVRVHADGRAADLSRSINAQAFTRGSDIYFATGRFSPGSRSGTRLLAHELTHVVQQGKAGERPEAVQLAPLNIQRQESSTGEAMEGEPTEAQKAVALAAAAKAEVMAEAARAEHRGNVAESRVEQSKEETAQEAAQPLWLE